VRTTGSAHYNVVQRKKRTRMKVTEYLSAQLGRPSGIFSKPAAILWNKRNLALNKAALKNLFLKSNDRVLEIGFGGGYLLGEILRYIDEGFLCGIDISPAMVTRCVKRYRRERDAGLIELKCAPAEAIPYEEKQFTKVCSVNSIFYWQDADRVFNEIGRVLAKDGRFVLCFTLKESLETKGFANHIQLYDIEEVTGMLKASGFQEIQVKTDSDRHRNFACVKCVKGKEFQKLSYEVSQVSAKY
jgi:ubiquinone/menaquinone biosynthesis C-methylase UbiE